MDFLTAEEARTNVQNRLQELRDALAQLQNNPGDPNAQQVVTVRRDEMAEAVESVADGLTPQDRSLLEKLGGGSFFSPELATTISANISAHGMTPAVVHSLLTAKHLKSLPQLRPS